MTLEDRFTGREQDRDDRAYEPPSLTALGPVAELTQVVGPSITDN